ncbi:MAG: 1-acyl-sn-glycerol-3-phosphate acyltransferase, partial [Chloroflexi bacterium]|nr:1-acyl-sn-glycerol-3-phosphate acyltransferase [Chloroflexota bacterium]
MPAFSWIAIRCLYATLLVASRLQIKGREGVPPRGPLIVASNHMSYLDPPLLSLSVPRAITFLAKEGVFFNPAGHLLARGWGAVPVERGGPGDLAALRHAMRVLQRDGVVGLFPEGTRDRGSLIPAKPGVALLATKTQAPILPVGITGTE